VNSCCYRGPPPPDRIPEYRPLWNAVPPARRRPPQPPPPSSRSLLGSHCSRLPFARRPSSSTSSASSTSSTSSAAAAATAATTAANTTTASVGSCRSAAPPPWHTSPLRWRIVRRGYPGTWCVLSSAPRRLSPSASGLRLSEIDDPPTDVQASHSLFIDLPVCCPAAPRHRTSNARTNLKVGAPLKCLASKGSAPQVRVKVGASSRALIPRLVADTLRLAVVRLSSTLAAPSPGSQSSGPLTRTSRISPRGPFPSPTYLRTWSRSSPCGRQHPGRAELVPGWGPPGDEHRHRGETVRNPRSCHSTFSQPLPSANSGERTSETRASLSRPHPSSPLLAPPSHDQPAKQTSSNLNLSRSLARSAPLEPQPHQGERESSPLVSHPFHRSAHMPAAPRLYGVWIIHALSLSLALTESEGSRTLSIFP
jgi:hypothetical protein